MCIVKEEEELKQAERSNIQKLVQVNRNLRDILDTLDPSSERSESVSLSHPRRQSQVDLYTNKQSM